MTERRVALTTLVVLIGVLGASLWGVGRGLPSRYSYYQDAVAPLRGLGFLERYADPVPDVVDKYPTFAYLYFGVAARIALEWRGDDQAAELLRIARERGPDAWEKQIDPTLWVDLEPYRDALSSMLVAGRVASASAAFLLALMGALLAALLFGPFAAPFAAALLGFHPYTVYYAHTTNVDVPYLAFAVGCLYFFARLLLRGGVVAPLLAGMFGALAAGVKDQVVAYLAFLPVVALYLEWRRRKDPTLSRRSPRLTLGGAAWASIAFILTYALAANWAFDFEGWVRHAQFGLSAEVRQQYDMVRELSPLKGNVYLTIYVATYFFRSAGWGGCLLMIAGLVYGIRRDRLALTLLIPAALVYLLGFVFRMHLVYPRHLMPFLFPCLILAAGWVASVVRGTRRRTLGVVAVGLVAFVVWRGVTVNRLWRADPRLRAAAFMEEMLPAGTKVLAATNHATPPPQIPVRCPQRWDSGNNVLRALKEFEPDILVKVDSTFLKPVVIPQHPNVTAIVELAGLPVVASFAREVDHPILDDVDALPVVVLFRLR